MKDKAIHSLECVVVNCIKVFGLTFLFSWTTGVPDAWTYAGEYCSPGRLNDIWN
jgi:hypothetical protein